MISDKIKPKKHRSICISSETYEKLDFIAKIQDVSMSQLATKLLNEALEQFKAIKIYYEAKKQGKEPMKYLAEIFNQKLEQVPMLNPPQEVA